MTLDDIIAPGTEVKVLGSGYGFTEGPAADAEGNVYFSDGRNDSIYFYEVGKAPRLFVDDSTDADGMMINGRGELCVCEGAAYRVVAVEVKTRQKRVLCSEIDGTHFNEPNDLAIDHQDGFYFSDPNYQHHKQPTVMREDVYYCAPNGVVTRVSTICFKPNGVLLSEDDTTLYVADARGQRIFRYDVAGPGQLANERLWIGGLGANPDGLTLDDHDNLYVCCGAAGLKVYDRDKRHVGTLDVHAANCCFGGRDFKTLMIASRDKFRAVATQVTGIKPPPLQARLARTRR
jgi:gluconolactonase